MKLEEVRAIADAVLYEGYLLYPYRHSALKNRQRWTYGVVYPRAYSEAGGGMEPWQMRTECLLTAEQGMDPLLTVHVRFLHLLQRTREGSSGAGERLAWEGGRGGVEDAWEEGVERTISTPPLPLSVLLRETQRLSFAFPARRLMEQDRLVGDFIVREQRALTGEVAVSAEQLAGQVFKLGVCIANTSVLPDAEVTSLRTQEALLAACISTHTILQARGAAFVSLTDPPAELRHLAETCRNSGTWPVLVGAPGERETLLSSPIILDDYPQIAPESLGPLFDGTEIDELLTLRIMTLTDEEKEQIRRGDERARALLERAERLTAEELMQLHGTLRGLGPVEEGAP